ncbi:MAG: metallophosphatase family protein [Bacteroidales bacterium]|jgi:putative phosphoesterase|nr:metallophosphatase family protein [Bacteroidales bacterium]
MKQLQPCACGVESHERLKMLQNNVSDTVKIGVLSDTHSFLHPIIFDFFKDCEQIWHLGDIGDVNIWQKLSDFKPLKAVYGNIDGAEIRNLTQECLFFEVGGLKVLLTHIGGYPPLYQAKSRELLQRFEPDIFACGHSHILKVMFDKKRQLLYINPGAAGKYGFHKAITMLRFEIKNKKPQNMEIFHEDKN